MLIIHSLDQVDVNLAAGKVLVFTLRSADVDDALHGVLAKHRARNDPIFLLNAADGEQAVAGLLPMPLAPGIPADRVDEEACAAIARLIDVEKPARVYLPAFGARYSCFAVQVWEGIRRAAHRTMLAVGEIDVPLPQVSAWVVHDGAPVVGSSAARHLQSFRAASFGSAESGHALFILDPKDTPLEGVVDQRRIIEPGTARASVIIRTAGRPTLRRALDSVARQTWPLVEVVIVNIAPAAIEPGVPADWPGLDVKEIHVPGAGRSAAANAGLDAVTGEYFAFLDDDDYLYPAHLSQLIGALQQSPGHLVAYGGIRVESEDASGAVRPSLLDEPFSLPRLRLRNFIPIHACVCRRQIIGQGIRFDTTLDKYEDWDFWLKIAERASFVHVPGAVGVYKVGNASEVAQVPAAAIYDRWIRRAGVAGIAEIAEWAFSDQTPAARALQLRLAACLRELERTSNGQPADPAGSAAGIPGDEPDALRSMLRRTRMELSTTQESLASTRHALTQAQELAAGVGHELRTVYGSNSWKLLSPVRSLVTLARAPGALRSLTELHGGGSRGLRHVLARAFRAVQRHGLIPVARQAHRMFLKQGGAVRLPPAMPMDVRRQRPPVVTPDVAIDIVVCVHNALDDVRRCLESIRRWTDSPYTLILVDDGSAAPTRDFLRCHATETGARLIRHEQAGGYTRAANAGMLAGGAAFVVLLNSDTVVGPQWLARLHACMTSDDRLALVGPLSNCASWQSIPEIECSAGGDWADNPLPAGVAPDEMAIRIARDSARIYPRLSFVNGFCQMIRRQALDEVGMLDEISFPQGYGEENDLCCRLRGAGWQLAVADDVWIYHAQSKSYSNERRLKLCAMASENLAAKHGAATIEAGALQCRDSLSLRGIRARTRRLHERQACLDAGGQAYSGKRILFLLPASDAGGGGNVIVTEARAMLRMGVDVAIANLAANRTRFEQNYGDSGVPVHYVGSPAEIVDLARDCDAVVASIYYTVDWLECIDRLALPAVKGYYVQDFEPSFFTPGSGGYQQALASYTRFPDLVRVCKTRWNRETVLKETGADTIVVGPSLDLDRFRPRESAPRERIRIAAMVRPNSPYRSPGLTMELLGDTTRAFGRQVDIVTFGVDADDPDFLVLRHDFDFRHLGKLNPAQLSEVLEQTDIFVDFSTYQAMGLTGLEAMASHCAVILPSQGGAVELAREGETALFVDARSPGQCRQALFRLIKDADLRRRLADNALAAVQSFHPEGTALNILRALFPAPDEQGRDDALPTAARSPVRTFRECETGMEVPVEEAS